MNVPVELRFDDGEQLRRSTADAWDTVVFLWAAARYAEVDVLALRHTGARLRRRANRRTLTR